MPAARGKPVPKAVKAFILSAATKDPTRTNADIVRMVRKKFGDSPDQTSVRRFRVAAGIPSSREASAMPVRSTGLTWEEKRYVHELLEKIQLPHPSNLHLNDVIIAVGEGIVGSRSKRVHIRLAGMKLTECWLTEKEAGALTNMLKKTNLDVDFGKLHKQGITIVGHILSHNQLVAFGSGEPTFAEVIQLVETVKPSKVGAVNEPVLKMWKRYTLFGRKLAAFKRATKEYLDASSTV